MTPADSPMPGADLQPIEDAPAEPVAPERELLWVPEEDEPESQETQKQPRRR